MMTETAYVARLEKYRKYCNILRQIHSNKSAAYHRRDFWHRAVTVAASVILTFVGFTGTTQLTKLINKKFASVQEDVVTFGFNILIVIILLLVLLELITRFSEKAGTYQRVIVTLTGFLRDLDDLLAEGAPPDRERTHVITGVRERYKLITEMLPANSDKEFVRAKRDLVEKNKNSDALDGRQKNAVNPAMDTTAEATTRSILAESETVIGLLRVIRQVSPELWLAGGVPRSCVWDYVHGFSVPTQVDDVDVVHFDPKNPEPTFDADIEKQLRSILPNVNWSVKNQARMHTRSGDEVYTSLRDAIEHWPETATAIAVRLDDRGSVELLAPYGYDDLINLRVRPARAFKNLAQYQSRLKSKNWQLQWPRLDVQLPEPADSESR